MNYKDIFKKANDVAMDLTYTQCGENVMIYPCGFAYVYLSNGIKGKRNPTGKALEALGLLKYDDYRKHYYCSVWDYNQSVTHKEAHAMFMSLALTELIGEKFEYYSRLD